MSTILRHFWEKYDSLILIAIAIFLVFVVAFKAGQLEKGSENAAKINISLANKKDAEPIDQRAKIIEETLQRKDIENKASSLISEKPSVQETQEKKECAFVASKNSTKYHLPNCKNATRIKDSNKICFSSEEEAKAKGYERAKCCFK